ncbi:PAQR family membrane homeostasis protein TrhA [Priestia taiwanensis]|uniref:Hemolysin III n=1 Tax=Priestia taiwanensis TaxID=1347902 RepID=A0A917AKK2_9BACI|nr:hemolysin III family protein [Priestia taiwanensis]MBM7362074.1 hemolysin III [Priestia taiwanensis]GGE59241.1 hemolysin III [Priestia taiwanensis]
MSYPLKEEIANAITHGVGALLSIPALIMLIGRATSQGDSLALMSSIIFGTSMFILYLCSTLMHSIHHHKVRKLFKILDHAAIYILIAGTYTPFLLLTIKGTLGWVLFAIIWTIAIGGVVFKSLFIGRFNVISTIAYVIMGWLIVVAIKPLYDGLELAGFWLLVGGGVLYTVGAIFYLWEKLPFNHAIWHVFVLSGSACMFLCVWLFVI